MKSEIYTPDLESQLIQYYNENVPNYFDRLKTNDLINYLDPSSKYHQYQVDVNGNYLKKLLIRAKREYDLKNILIYTKK